MKNLILAVMLTAPLSACDTLPGVDWPTAVQCGTELADDLFPAVNTILLEDRGRETMGSVAESKLTDMAIEHGPDVIACLVDGVIKRWTSGMATQTPEREQNVRRAQAWQAKTGTVVQ